MCIVHWELWCFLSMESSCLEGTSCSPASLPYPWWEPWLCTCLNANGSQLKEYCYSRMSKAFSDEGFSFPSPVCSNRPCNLPYLRMQATATLSRVSCWVSAGILCFCESFLKHWCSPGRQWMLMRHRMASRYSEERWFHPYVLLSVLIHPRTPWMYTAQHDRGLSSLCTT